MKHSKVLDIAKKIKELNSVEFEVLFRFLLTNEVFLKKLIPMWLIQMLVICLTAKTLYEAGKFLKNNYKITIIFKNYDKKVSK